MKNILFVFYLFILSHNSFSQLSKLHYIPPIFTIADLNVDEHRLVLSTPVEESFYVKIFQGKGGFVDSVKISKSHSNVFSLGDYTSAIGVFYNLEDLNIAQDSGGLKLEADYPFYANIRNLSINQGASLSSKGLAGLGTEFRTGHMVNGYRKDDVTLISSNFISVMATRNNTVVRVKDISKGVNFYGLKKKKRDPSTTGIHTFKLNKGQSYIIAERSEDVVYGNQNNSFGTLITSTKPIAVNCGSTMGINALNEGGWDNGFDQIVPIGCVGAEYVLVRGQGINEMEAPVVVGAYDDTKVVLNGKELTTLNAGDHYILDGADYNRNWNMHIESDKDFYVYQGTSGDQGTITGALNFVPPMSNCENFNEVSITDIGYLGGFAVVNIVTTVGSEVRIIDQKKGTVLKVYNNDKSNLSKGLDLNWVSYRYVVPQEIQDLLVSSDQVINVSLTNNSGAIGAASYFSGFLPVPEILPRGGQVAYFADGALNLDIGNDELYDEYQWYRDGQLVSKTNAPTYKAEDPGTYFVKCVSTACGNEFESESYTIEPIVAALEDTTKKVKIQDTDEGDVIAVIKNPDFNPKILVNLTFRSNSDRLTNNSLPNLEEMISALKKFPQVSIEIRAHTDCRGSADYNLSLSQKRAVFVKQYMVNQGIKESRLKAIGLGESEPLSNAKCDCDVKGSCNDNYHRLNRRSEFIIIR